MKHAVITLCCGEYHQQMGAITHPTLAAYAHRIGAEFIVWSDATGHTFPHYKKMELANLLDDFDRVLYVDTDILIREDAPDIFSIVPADAMGLLDENLFVDRRIEIIRFMEQNGFDSSHWDGHYYNTGVMVFSRQHREIFVQPAVEWDGVLKEQNYLNAMISKCKLKVFALPYRFNKVYPMEPVLGEQRFDSYFMHYAGATDGMTKERLLQLIREDLEVWQKSKPEYQFRKNLAFVVDGGLGDQVAAEPAMRYARDVMHHGDNIVLVSAWPEVFRHLHLAVYPALAQVPLSAQYRVRYTRAESDPALAGRLDPDHIHRVDLASIVALDRELPQAYKTAKLSAATAAWQSAAQKIGPLDPGAIVLLHPGCGSAADTFGADAWQSYADALTSQDIRVAVIGNRSGADYGVVDFDRSRCLDLLNKLTAAELIAIVSRARVLISNDAAPVQIAGAFEGWIGLVAARRHPEFVQPWRHGSQFWRARNLERRPLYQEVSQKSPSDRQQAIDALTPERLRDYLPEPAAILDFVRAALDGRDS